MLTLPRAFCVSRRPDSPGWPKDRLFELKAKGPRPAGTRWTETEKHLLSQGIKAEPFWCIDWQVSGLETKFTYDLDHPGTNFKTHPMRICNCLSQVLLWRVCAYLPDDEILIFEDDVRFLPGWQENYERARSVLPDDWDMLFIGSCNCAGKPTVHIGENLYHVKWPFCTHAYIVRKKALPVLDENMQKFYAPIDIAMALHVFPKLNVYTILPRIAEQFETKIDP